MGPAAIERTGSSGETCQFSLTIAPGALRRQSDRVNDDWTRRYSELRLGTEFDLVPTAEEGARSEAAESPSS